MAGVVVCHGAPAARERIVVTCMGVPALSPVRAAASVEELLTVARRTQPSVVLLDAHVPVPGPIDAIRRLRVVAPQAAVVLLAGPEDATALDRALALGARGFLTPDVGRAELSAVAAHVLAAPAVGGRRGADVSSPAIASEQRGSRTGVTLRAVDGGQAPSRTSPGDASVTAMPPVRDVPMLTKREVEVLVGMSNGRSNAQIGAELFLSEDTVKTHARRLFRKLGAADRAQAVAIGLRRGLIR